MLDSVTIDKRTVMPHLFGPGNNANPKGRPKGSKNKIAEKFLDALLDDFSEHGAVAIAQCRETNVAAYLNVCAKMVPVEFNINQKSAFDEMSVHELLALGTAITGRLSGTTIEGAGSVVETKTGIVPTVSEAEIIP